MRYWLLICLLTLSACNLGTDDATPTDEPIDVPTVDPGRPEVRIISPQEGAEFVVDDPILINVLATDTIGVESIQLFANGDVVRSVASQSPTGDANFPALLDYTPLEPGQITFTVIALRDNVQSAPAEVTVEVRRSQFQVTATSAPGSNDPIIDPNDPTCRALVSTNLNFRRGPGVEFEVIRVLGAGEVLPIVGKLRDESWWQLQSGTITGWVSGSFITRFGNCSLIPVIDTNTPTPTPTTTATATNTPTPTPTDPPADPDLIVSNFVGPNPVVIPSGEADVTVDFAMTVTNRGGDVNTQFSNAVRLLPIGDDVDAGVVASLSAGQSINLTVAVTFSTTGTFALEARADSVDDISESDEGNNIRVITVTVERES